MVTELSPQAREFRFRSCPEGVSPRVHEEWRNTPAARAQQPRQEEVDMPRTRVLAAMLPALALVAVGSVASANPTTTHTRYALRTKLAPAPDALASSHAHPHFTVSVTRTRPHTPPN